MLEKVIKNDDRTTADEGGGTQEYANNVATYYYGVFDPIFHPILDPIFHPILQQNALLKIGSKIRF